jgi:PHD/YefM family antitoxin component YafN of YafNO toxin-antitoxin module
MITISANEIKKRGISAFVGHNEAFVTVRGKPRYIVMDINTYESLREVELEMALIQTRRDIENGNYVVESVADHIKRVTEIKPE